MINQGAGARADFVVACRYDRIGTTIQMNFSLYDVVRGQLVATAVRERKQTLLVEWSISDVIAGFLDRIKDRLVFVDQGAELGGQAEESAQGLSGSTDSGPERQIQEDSDRVAEIDVKTDPHPPAAETASLPAEITGAGPRRISRPYLDDISKRFELVSGMAPYVLMGKTSEYARLGSNTALSMGYRFIGDQAQVILAISTGASTFHTESTATSSQVLLIPLAAQISLRTTPSRLGFLIHLAGGLSAFPINPNQGGYRFKLVPYAASGIGVEFPILQHLGILVDLSFMVYFGGSQPVMGYAPSANLYYRF